jgi:hypothetical protein
MGIPIPVKKIDNPSQYQQAYVTQALINTMNASHHFSCFTEITNSDKETKIL